MSLFADRSISTRRPDQAPEALYFDHPGPIEVAAKQPFTFRAGRRVHGGLAVRFGVILTPGDGGVPAAFLLQFGDKAARLAVSRQEGLWTVDSEDAEEPIPVASSPLVAGVSVAVEVVADFGSMTWRDVVVDGRRVPVQVIDEIEGMPKAPEEFVVDVMNGGLEVAIPEWAAEIVRSYSAEDLLALAREQGGRIVCRRQPPPDIEEVPRPAPLVSVEDGQPYFTFSVEGGPMTADRIWATEA